MFRLASVLVTVLVAAAAQAQITTTHVRVHIHGKRCGELRNVFLVIDGADNDNRWIALKDAGNCEWTKDLGKSDSFSTALSRFSLRVDLGRTDCHRAVANEKDFVAELTFNCCNEGVVRNVHVKTNPTMPVS